MKLYSNVYKVKTVYRVQETIALLFLISVLLPFDEILDWPFAYHK